MSKSPQSMQKKEKSKLTGEVKISRNSPVILTANLVRRKDLEKAARILKGGGVVIFPTDTVYGIGCRFDDQKAIDRIYQIKGTPKVQPFPILVSSIKQVNKIAKVNKVAKSLISKYWPGGLTIILPSFDPVSRQANNVARYGIVSGHKLGIRMPDSKLIQTLIKLVGTPLVGTSANFHGAKTPTSFGEFDPEFVKLADYAVKGECKKGIESTVVDATENEIRIIRQGAISL